MSKQKKLACLTIAQNLQKTRTSLVTIRNEADKIIKNMEQSDIQGDLPLFPYQLIDIRDYAQHIVSLYWETAGIIAGLGKNPFKDKRYPHKALAFDQEMVSGKASQAKITWCRQGKVDLLWHGVPQSKEKDGMRQSLCNISAKSWRRRKTPPPSDAKCPYCKVAYTPLSKRNYPTD